MTMKWWLLLALLSMGVDSAWARQPAGLREQLRDPYGRTLVVSHRACWMFTAENTLDGIRACIGRGVDMVEVDIRTTADGELVLMHDETVDRTTDGHGEVARLSAAAIRALRNHPSQAGLTLTAGSHPPTLAEALALVKGRVLINLDIKAADLDRVMDVVEHTGTQRDVLMNVPLSMTKAQQRRAHAAGIAFQPVLQVRRSDGAPLLDDLMRRALAMRPTAIQLLFDRMSTIVRAQSLARGKARLFANTMTSDLATGHPMNLSGRYTDARAADDPDAVWGVLQVCGVSLLQTDRPVALRAYLATASGKAKGTAAKASWPQCEMTMPDSA